MTSLAVRSSGWRVGIDAQDDDPIGTGVTLTVECYRNLSSMTQHALLVGAIVEGPSKIVIGGDGSESSPISSAKIGRFGKGLTVGLPSEYEDAVREVLDISASRPHGVQHEGIQVVGAGYDNVASSVTAFRFTATILVDLFAAIGSGDELNIELLEEIVQTTATQIFHRD